MKIDTVELTSHPMLYVSRTCAMKPEAIAQTMGPAFHVLGEFIGKNGIIPTGAPYAIYREWDDKEITFDVGFPVRADMLVKATGEIKVGVTPAGRALKAIHKGPYEKLSESYAEFESYAKEAGLPDPDLTWEIYVTDPDSVQPDELVTELYMALPD